ncbi:MAG: response regulator [Aquabacterium sp.]
MSDKDPYRYFRIEARELLDEMSGAILSLEKEGAGAPVVARLLRLAHTLKGAARVVKQPGIAEHAHAMEDALSAWRDKDVPVPSDVLTAMLARLDQMDAMLAKLAKPAQHAPQQEAAGVATPPRKPALPDLTDAAHQADKATSLHAAPDTPATQPAGHPPLDEGWRSLARPLQELGPVLDGLSSSHVQVAIMRRHVDAVQQASELARTLLDQIGKRRHAAEPGEGQVATLRGRVVHDMAEELSRRLVQLDAALMRTTDHLDRELQSTRDTAEQLQLVPARQLFTSLERTVRDVAVMQHKQAAFHGEGGELRLDDRTLKLLQPAFVQLVRNAVAHGIESPPARQAAGKPPQGRITLHLQREGSHVVLSCTDDGAGIDTDAVLLRAGQRSHGASARDIQHLLLEGGISTADAVTEASGRGIGLNVVKDAVQQLGGRVRLDTRRGHGTTWTLHVPMNRAMVQVLTVQMGNLHVQLPMDKVCSASRLPASQIVHSGAQPSILHEGKAIPFITLAQVMDEGQDLDSRETWSTVILSRPDGFLALGVDRLRGVSHVVMRPLPHLAPASPCVAGVSLDAEGRPQWVLDVALLPLHPSAGMAPQPAASTIQAPILVVDDSLTSRMLEESILNAAGFAVETAASAEEALARMADQAYGLLLVDVDMPGMDGFGLVAHLRQHEAWRDIPAVLVTSRGTPEDIERGRQAGADAHIVKGDFSQGIFLDTVRRLLARTRPS